MKTLLQEIEEYIKVNGHPPSTICMCQEVYDILPERIRNSLETSGIKIMVNDIVPRGNLLLTG